MQGVWGRSLVRKLDSTYYNEQLLHTTIKTWHSHVTVKSLSRVRLFATPWTVAYQALQSMECSRQEYWSGLPFPSPDTAIYIYIYIFNICIYFIYIYIYVYILCTPGWCRITSLLNSLVCNSAPHIYIP